MSYPVILTLVAAPIVGLILLLLVRRLTAPSTISECDPEWVANFTTASYRPMLRLLGEEDFNFLAAQPGITSETVRTFRRERRRVFRTYLRSLVRDFHRLHLAARMTLLYASEDRPDLAQALLRQRVMFAWAVTTVEFRLLLHAAGLAAVDVRGLIGALEDMRLNVGSFTPSAEPAGI